MVGISISADLPSDQTQEAYEALDWVDIGSCTELKVSLKPCYVARGERVGVISCIDFYDINGGGTHQAKLERLDVLYKFTFNGKVPSRRMLRSLLKRIKFS